MEGRTAACSYARLGIDLRATTVSTDFRPFRKIRPREIACPGEPLALAAVELTHRNTRRYGGYLVHMGIVLMFIGFTGAAFNKNRVDEMKPGDSVTLGSYRLTLKDTLEGQNDNYLWRSASIVVMKNGADAGVLTPESRIYTASRQPTHQVALRTRLNED